MVSATVLCALRGSATRSWCCQPWRPSFLESISWFLLLYDVRAWPRSTQNTCESASRESKIGERSPPTGAVSRRLQRRGRMAGPGSGAHDPACLVAGALGSGARGRPAVRWPMAPTTTANGPRRRLAARTSTSPTVPNPDRHRTQSRAASAAVPTTASRFPLNRLATSRQEYFFQRRRAAPPADGTTCAVQEPHPRPSPQRPEPLQRLRRPRLGQRHRSRRHRRRLAADAQHHHEARLRLRRRGGAGAFDREEPDRAQAVRPGALRLAVAPR